MKRPKTHSRVYEKTRVRRGLKKRPPRTAEQYFAKSRRFQAVWDRLISVVSRMRGEKVSLQQASRQIGISPSTVIRWGKGALRKHSNGRYTAKANDRLLRVLMVPTPHGTTEIVVADSRKATLIAEYWNAVHRYLETGDASGLKKFRGRNIRDANGNQISLITDRAELNRLGSAGVLSFESLYARTA